MQVNYPTAPHGVSQSDFDMNSNNGASGTAWTDNNVLLFEVENSEGDPNEVTINVSDYYGNNSFVATGVLDWDAGNFSTRYVEFSDFPLQADQVTPMDQCKYVASVVNTTDNNSGTEVRVRIYRG